MQRKIIYILIAVVVSIIAGMTGFYFYLNNQKSNTNNTSDTNQTGYQTFNPFGTGTTVTTTVTDNTSTIPATIQTPTVSKFHKLTDFAVAGATYFEDTRPLISPLISEEGVGGGDLTGNKTTPAKTIAKPATPKFETVPSLRYVEKSTGHIYQMYLDNKITGTVSNTTIPSIYESIFDNSAQSVIYRYV